MLDGQEWNEFPLVGECRDNFRVCRNIEAISRGFISGALHIS